MEYYDCNIHISSPPSEEKRKLSCFATNVTHNCDADFSMYGNETYTELDCDGTYKYLRENLDYSCNCIDIIADPSSFNIIYIVLGCMGAIFIIIGIITAVRQYKLSGSLIQFLNRR